MKSRQQTKTGRFLQNYTRPALTQEQRMQVVAKQETDRAINIFLQCNYAEIEARIIAHHLRYRQSKTKKREESK